MFCCFPLQVCAFAFLRACFVAYFCLCWHFPRIHLGLLGRLRPRGLIPSAPDPPTHRARSVPPPFGLCAVADTPPYVWGASRKGQNRLAHIKYGNGAQARGEGCASDALRIGTANVTSLHSQIQCVGEFKCAVTLLQETRITDLNQAAMRGLLRRYSWDVLWGHGVPSAHVGGVAMLVKPEHSATQIAPATAEGVEASRAGRLMIAAIALNRGNRVL